MRVLNVIGSGSIMLVPSVIILVGSLIILSKTRTTGAILLLTGNLITIVACLFYVVLRILFITEVLSLGQHNSCMFAFRIVSILASFVFAFGFIRIAKQMESPA